MTTKKGFQIWHSQFEKDVKERQPEGLAML